MEYVTGAEERLNRLREDGAEVQQSRLVEGVDDRSLQHRPKQPKADTHPENVPVNGTR
jgi:hypothetical protein